MAKRFLSFTPYSYDERGNTVLVHSHSVKLSVEGGQPWDGVLQSMSSSGVGATRKNFGDEGMCQNIFRYQRMRSAT